LDKDPVDPSRERIRWAYDPLNGTATGEGANDWYCERLWAIECVNVPARNRAAYQKEIAKDLDKAKAWRSKRGNFIESVKARHVKGKFDKESKRAAGKKSVSVRKRQFNKTELIKPDNMFWPMARYRRKFGSPDLPKNKKLKHVRSKVNGVKGVVVPGDDGEGPFRLRSSEGVELQKDDEEDVGSSGGEDELAADRVIVLYYRFVRFLSGAHGGGPVRRYC
jgi:hypothetical protein